jgi:DNA-binding SARP family transcriptional activator/Tfp pilus assembly protein PilF
MEPLRIYLLGELRVYRGEERVDLPTKPIKSLFAYLLTHRQRGFPPEVLAGTFWGEASEKRARASLNSALSSLRRLLPEASILSEYGNIRLNPESALWLDVEEFERKIKEGRRSKRPEAKVRCLEEAIELYQGDFMEGFYDDWVLFEQERLRELYLEALRELADCHKALKEYDRAIAYCKKILERSPLREEVHRELIYLYYLSGDRNEALLQYRRCCKTLKEALQVEPLPETRALYEEIQRRADLESLKLLVEPVRRAELLLTRYPELGAPFVGRAHELSVLLRHWQLAEGGEGGVVFIEGEAGIGKSRLAREFIDLITGEGSLALLGRCYKAERGLPFTPIIEALRRSLAVLELAQVPPLWLAEVARLLPELCQLCPELKLNLSLPPRGKSGRLFEGLNQLLFALSRARPLCLFLDDLHWADDSTLQYLHYLARHLSKERVLLLCAYRAEEVSEALQELVGQLAHEGSMAKLRLSNLSKAGVRELIAGMLKAEEGIEGLIDTIYAETEGNPFLVVELVRALIAGGALCPSEGGRWKVAIGKIEDYIPAGVQELIGTRLRRLSGPARRLLDLGAVLGREFEPAILEQADGPGDGITEPLDELLRAHLLVEEEGRYSFSHELFRQAVYKGLSGARRKRLHLQAGKALELAFQGRTSAIAGELARHFYQAERWEKALEYLILAGKEARRVYANREALEFFRQAEELAQELESRGYDQSKLWQRRFDLLEMRAAIYETIYDILEAKAQLKQDIEAMIELARNLGDEARLARAYQKRAELWFALGKHREALGETHKALEMMRNLRDERGAGEALKNLAAFHVQLGEYTQGLEYYRQASKLYSELGDKREQAHALRRLGVIHEILAQYEEAREYYREARALYGEIGDKGGEGAVLNNLGLAHYAAGEYAAAAECYEEALERFAEVGDRRGQGIALINMGALCNELQDYEGALRHLGEALLIAKEPGMKGLEIEALSQMSLAYLGLGERAKALERSSSAVQLLEKGGHLVDSHVIFFNHSRVLAANGLEGGARSYLEKAYQELMRKAGEIRDEPMRKSFLENVRVNREIVAVCREAWGEAGGRP